MDSRGIFNENGNGGDGASQQGGSAISSQSLVGGNTQILRPPPRLTVDFTGTNSVGFGTGIGGSALKGLVSNLVSQVTAKAAADQLPTRSSMVEEPPSATRNSMTNSVASYVEQVVAKAAAGQPPARNTMTNSVASYVEQVVAKAAAGQPPTRSSMAEAPPSATSYVENVANSCESSQRIGSIRISQTGAQRISRAETQAIANSFNMPRTDAQVAANSMELSAPQDESNSTSSQALTQVSEGVRGSMAMAQLTHRNSMQLAHSAAQESIRRSMDMSASGRNSATPGRTSIAMAAPFEGATMNFSQALGQSMNSGNSLPMLRGGISTAMGGGKSTGMDDHYALFGDASKRLGGSQTMGLSQGVGQFNVSTAMATYGGDGVSQQLGGYSQQVADTGEGNSQTLSGIQSALQSGVQSTNQSKMRSRTVSHQVPCSMQGGISMGGPSTPAIVPTRLNLNSPTVNQNLGSSPTPVLNSPDSKPYTNPRNNHPDAKHTVLIPPENCVQNADIIPNLRTPLQPTPQRTMHPTAFLPGHTNVRNATRNMPNRFGDPIDVGPETHNPWNLNYKNPRYVGKLRTPASVMASHSGLLSPTQIRLEGRLDCANLIHENQEIKNLLIAWQNAYADMEEAYKSTEKEKSQLLEDCSEQIRLAKKNCVDALQDLFKEGEEKRREIVNIRKQIYGQVKEAADLYRQNEDLEGVLKVTRKQMDLLLGESEKVEREFRDSVRSLATDLTNQPQMILENQYHTLRNEDSKLLKENLEKLQKIRGLYKADGNMNKALSDLKSIYREYRNNEKEILQSPVTHQMLKNLIIEEHIKEMKTVIGESLDNNGNRIGNGINANDNIENRLSLIKDARDNIDPEKLTPDYLRSVLNLPESLVCRILEIRNRILELQGWRTPDRRKNLSSPLHKKKIVNNKDEIPPVHPISPALKNGFIISGMMISPNNSVIDEAALEETVTKLLDKISGNKNYKKAGNIFSPISGFHQGRRNNRRTRILDEGQFVSTPFSTGTSVINKFLDTPELAKMIARDQYEAVEVKEASLWSFAAYKVGLPEVVSMLEKRSGFWYLNGHVVQTQFDPIADTIHVRKGEILIPLDEFLEKYGKTLTTV